MALLLAVSLVLFGRVDMSLFHFWQQRISFPVWEYLRIPGGFSDYLAVLFTEALSDAPTETLVPALGLLVIMASLHVVFREQRSHPLFHPLLLLAMFPFMLMLTYYRMPLELWLSLLVAHVATAAFFLGTHHPVLSSPWFTLVWGLVIYWLAGPVGLIVWIQGMALAGVKRSSRLLPGFIALLLALPLLHVLTEPGISWKQAFAGPFIPGRYEQIPVPLFFSLATLLSLFLLLRLSASAKGIRAKRKHVISLAGLLAVSLAMVFSAMEFIRENERNGYRVLEAGQEKNWEEVLRLSQAGLPYNSLIQFEVNRALQQRGVLLDRMFSYSQVHGAEGLFLEGFSSSRIALILSDFYYDMGFANETRHWGTEAQMALTRHPCVLKNLVMSYAAIGMDEIAEKYLRILGRSRIHHQWNREIGRMIVGDSLDRHPDILRFVHNNPKQDFFASSRNSREKLRLFFLSTGNRMAFEYQMAAALLDHDLDAIMRNMQNFRRLGYEKLPRHIQEAVCIYVLKTQSERVNLAGFGLDRQVMDDFRAFNRILQSTGNLAEQRRNAAQFKHSYWHYVLFDTSHASWI